MLFEKASSVWLHLPGTWPDRSCARPLKNFPFTCVHTLLTAYSLLCVLSGDHRYFFLLRTFFCVVVSRPRFYRFLRCVDAFHLVPHRRNGQLATLQIIDVPLSSPNRLTNNLLFCVTSRDSSASFTLCRLHWTSPVSTLCL